MARAPSMTPFDYVLEAERELPKNEQTIFHLRPLTWRELEQVERGAKMSMDVSGGEAKKMDLETNRLKFCRSILNYGLLGWENLLDEGGNEVHFEKASEKPAYGRRREFLPDEMLDCIFPWAEELADAVSSSSKVDRGTAKNSG